MITRLGLLDIAASPACSIMVWSKVETEGEAYIKTLGQQVLVVFYAEGVLFQSSIFS